MTFLVQRNRATINETKLHHMTTNTQYENLTTVRRPQAAANLALFSFDCSRRCDGGGHAPTRQILGCLLNDPLVFT